MSNPRGYPDVIASVESGRPLTRGIKRLSIIVDGTMLTYNQPGWWASLDDPNDTEGQMIDEDNLVRSRVIAARRKFLLARHALKRMLE